MKNLNEIKQRSVLRLLEMYKKANAGHIGASLSCLDLLIYLHFEVCSKDDAVILSKGHAAGALYVVLEEAGKIPFGSVDQFYKEGTPFAAHPPCSREFSAIPFGTGSLGHGVGLATGIALAAKLKSSNKKVYVIASDGELNEGSTWESIMFASHHQLDNLTIIVDQNGLQGLGSTKDIIDMGSLEHKMSSFGLETVMIENGNDFKSIDAAFKNPKKTKAPQIFIAKTTKGAGVSYMENKFEWHYLPMSDEQYQIALQEFRSKNA